MLYKLFISQKYSEQKLLFPYLKSKFSDEILPFLNSDTKTVAQI